MTEKKTIRDCTDAELARVCTIGQNLQFQGPMTREAMMGALASLGFKVDAFVVVPDDPNAPAGNKPDIASLRARAKELGVNSFGKSAQVLQAEIQMAEAEALDEDDGLDDPEADDINAIVRADRIRQRKMTAHMEERIRIQIDATEEAGGGQPVPVMHNGIAILIPRGEPVTVKRKFVAALEDAEQLVYDPVTDGLGGTRPPRKVPSFRYRILGDPVAA